MGTLPEDFARTVKKVGEGNVFIGLSSLLMENCAISVTMKVVHMLYASFVYGIFLSLWIALELLNLCFCLLCAIFAVHRLFIGVNEK